MNWMKTTIMMYLRSVNGLTSLFPLNTKDSGKKMLNIQQNRLIRPSTKINAKFFSQWTGFLHCLFSSDCPLSVAYSILNALERVPEQTGTLCALSEQIWQ